MDISCDPHQGSLEALRPTHQVAWESVASGLWSEGRHHGGHIEYRLAQSAPRQWMLESIERNAALDSVTQEDVDEGRLNDDQIQVLWGQTLEDAQGEEIRQIVVVCNAAPHAIGREMLLTQMFNAIKDLGGKIIVEPDDLYE
ncbi:hypothetical protein [Sphingomonas sp. LY160]|uniref:hypothetical protein n=1 Tax=Sphingomonas sp. LY160 TaxID=3095342 RepID=UPI002ADECCFF|nr:hypothetical protein [Sphingomonas sp. LY160]MEA1071771.1 hypothetical protein [Sphingomonas sp. LY160]